MGGKKKSMANKLAKMSEEERLRYLQHRADIEEESRRKKEQLLSTFMKNKVNKEDAFARLNLAKINQNWHHILRKDKCKRLKESVLDIQEDFTRILANKDCSIKFLWKQIDEAEVQYGYNYQNHIMQIDNIMKTQEEYLHQMKVQYENDRHLLINDFNNEMDEISGKHKQDIQYLTVLTSGEEMISKRHIWMQYQHYKSNIYKIINENFVEMRQLQISREQTSSVLWRLITAAVLQYTTAADRRRSHLAELRTLDHEGAAEVVVNQANIQCKEAEIIALNKKYDEIVADGNSQVLNLQTTFEKISKKCLNMKIYLNKQLVNDDKRFVLLVNESGKATEYLERVLEKGRQIKQLIDICKKLETIDDDIELIAVEYKENKSRLQDDRAIKEIEEETDKFLTKFNTVLNGRFIKSSLSSDESSSASSDKLTGESAHSSKTDIFTTSTCSSSQAKRSFGGDQTDDMFDILKDLDRVWKKHNQVYMNITALKQEKADLDKSSEEYRCLLRQMLGHIMVLNNQTRVIPTEEVHYRTIIKC